jgi:hypothetical protein
MRTPFFQKYSATYKLPAGPAIGLGQILGRLAADPDILDVRWAAYVLATIKHECADVWHPIEEFGKGKGRPYGTPITLTDSSGKQYINTYYGRGYVQLTWKNNYQKLGHALGLGDDLMYHPEKALSPDLAYQIMSYGMRTGSFTGKKLADYIHDRSCNDRDARQIINGRDSCDKIADYAQHLEKLLHASVT